MHKYISKQVSISHLITSVI